MPSLPLQLPLFQSWSCHNCSGCCRQHLIEITDEERRRIDSQAWTAADGLTEGRAPYVWFAGPPWKKRYRLAHRDDGACVFLNAQGLCRIHAKFGEAAKPLPCRIYPYAMHPSGKKIAVSLRFSCPSVVANSGKPVSAQTDELKAIQRAIVPEHADQIPPPAVSRKSRVHWADFQRFADALDQSLSVADRPLVTRLVETLFWVRLVDQSQFDAIRGPRLAEYLSLVREAAVQEITANPPAPQEPSRAGRLQFRMLVAQYARQDTFASASRGWGGRLWLLGAALRFARGAGNVPRLQPLFGEVPFAALETPFGELTADQDAMLTRYFRVKIQGLHFCGPAYYGFPFTVGFYSLALVFPVVLWLARWLAVGDGRKQLMSNDIAEALAVADHHHGYSPAIGTASARRRVRLLTHGNDLERLCLWYAR